MLLSFCFPTAKLFNFSLDPKPRAGDLTLRARPQVCEASGSGRACSSGGEGQKGGLSPSSQGAAEFWKSSLENEEDSEHNGVSRTSGTIHPVPSSYLTRLSVYRRLAVECTVGTRSRLLRLPGLAQSMAGTGRRLQRR